MAQILRQILRQVRGQGASYGFGYLDVQCQPDRGQGERVVLGEMVADHGVTGFVAHVDTEDTGSGVPAGTGDEAR
ncbi:hypothetical protein [Streptomyces sp. NPDC006879]|uniref:hypothetical protein n=1 Tax=Streptomyces sp. NPDC006879 TaxID=3364767 RepID=UPI0036820A44